MNTPRIKYQDSIHQSHGLISDFSFDFTDCSSQMGTNCFLQQQPCTGSAMEQNLRPATIMGGFKSPASALYATELFMGFVPQLPSTQIFPSNSTPVDPGFGSIVRSQFCGNELSKMIPYGDNDVPVSKQLLSPLAEEQAQDQRLHGSSASGSVPTGVVVSSKLRIRWTQELHEKFVECVNRLHGAEKATPKAILKLMDTQGLTIFHVKSHLQKYRIAKFMPEKAEGKSDKRVTMNDLPQLDSKTGLQLREALQLQLDVQRKLHEQLEIQRKLQLRIEEQGKQLRMMFDQQQRANTPLKSGRDCEESRPQNNLSGGSADVAAKEDGSNNTIFPSKIS